MAFVSHLTASVRNQSASKCHCTSRPLLNALWLFLNDKFIYVYWR